MSINKFRYRADIYRVVQGQPDGMGGYYTSKELQAQVWCRLIDNGGTRSGEDQTIINRNSYTVMMRAGYIGMKPEDIIEVEGVELTINSIQVDEYKRWITCECSADG